MSPNLLVTKLFFPPARENLFPRPQLMEKVAPGLRRPLLLISASAGYGKTTLMSEWRLGPGSQVPATRLSLEKDDNDVTRFLIYLATALGTLTAGVGETVLVNLQSPQPPPPLINDLIVALSTPFVLVLDDCLLITSQPVHKAVTFLFDHLPP